MNSTERLIYMANQIALNFAIQGEAAAISATADHLEKFWDPRMKRMIAESEREGLSTIAKAAVDLLGR
jgi:formate dehydrogenase subunit delta